MPVTMKQVRAHLDREEPDYLAASQLGSDAIPHLMQIVKGSDSMLASKAVYLASLIKSDQSNDILEQAATSTHIEVRIAAAAGIRNIKKAPISLIDNLLKDQDLGVRKVTLNSIKVRPIKGLKVKIEDIAQKDPEVFIRNLASEIAKRLE
jgi:hypothetical protein